MGELRPLKIALFSRKWLIPVLATDPHGRTQTIISADMAEIMVWASGRYFIFENRILFQNKGVIFSLTSSHISRSDESFIRLSQPNK